MAVQPVPPPGPVAPVVSTATVHTVSTTGHGVHTAIAVLVPGWVGDLEDWGTLGTGVLALFAGTGFLVSHSAIAAGFGVANAMIAGGLQFLQRKYPQVS